jgi:hypothetical protein
MITVHKWLSRLIEKGARYWATAFIVFFLTITGSSYVYDYLNLTDARSKYFQKLLEYGPRPTDPKFVRIVLVEDDDYWHGDLARIMQRFELGAACGAVF